MAFLTSSDELRQRPRDNQRPLFARLEHPRERAGKLGGDAAAERCTVGVDAGEPRDFTAAPDDEDAPSHRRELQHAPNNKGDQDRTAEFERIAEQALDDLRGDR